MRVCRGIYGCGSRLFYSIDSGNCLHDVTAGYDFFVVLFFIVALAISYSAECMLALGFVCG